MRKSSFKVILAPQALEALDRIDDPQVQKEVIRWIDSLGKKPEDQGKALAGELSSYRSLKVSGTGFRIIYRVEGERVVVYTVAEGITRMMVSPSFHSLTRQMIRTRLLELEDLDD